MLRQICLDIPDGRVLPSRNKSHLIMLSKARPDLRAIIVGGSVAGLTLAHVFEKVGIDYTIFERRDISRRRHHDFANGAGILDQLGVYKNMDLIPSSIQYSTTTYAPVKLNPAED
ncbi:hypothetical protein B0O99DRAFT_342619 [Bisporella sp. PMI_857]|nr:hypothetical protein B0O99DRAFT_342619 [Bisporella sp. PMI_857]